MQRAFSILLALLFGLGPLSVALPGGDEAALPPCCRRHGAHHCAMAARMAAMMAAAEEGKTAVSAPATCPNYPGPVFALLLPTHALATVRHEFAARETVTATVQSSYPLAASNASESHAGRGPPAFQTL